MARKTYDSGAERDSLDEVRYDLISPIALRRLAATYAEGARKYSDHNWRKGFPVSSLLNHVLAHLNAYLAREDSPGISLRGSVAEMREQLAAVGFPEDHLAHAAWGLFAIMEQEETHPELDDRWVFDREHREDDLPEGSVACPPSFEPGKMYHYPADSPSPPPYACLDACVCPKPCPSCAYGDSCQVFGEYIPVVDIREKGHSGLHIRGVAHYHEDTDEVFIIKPDTFEAVWMSYERWCRE